MTTLNGLGTPEHPHPLQTAYVEEQVVQCGYCLNGWIMTAAAFLKTKKHPTEDEIRQALTGLKCRCGTHTANCARSEARRREDGVRRKAMNANTDLDSPAANMMASAGALVFAFSLGEPGTVLAQTAVMATAR